IPPAAPFEVRATQEASIDMTARDLERRVVDADQHHDRRWVILVFHALCYSSCTARESTHPLVFHKLLDWLEAQRSDGKVAVRTVGDVMANGLQASRSSPHTTITCSPTACADPARGSSGVVV